MYLISVIFKEQETSPLTCNGQIETLFLFHCRYLDKTFRQFAKVSQKLQFVCKVDEKAMIMNRCNRIRHPVQNTKREKNTNN